MKIPFYKKTIPKITTEQMIEVDRLMIEVYGIQLIQMMENAGRALALVAKTVFLNDQLKGKKIAVLAGAGGNGGGALVAARRLISWGATVHVFLTKSELTTIPAHQLEILQKMKAPIFQGDKLFNQNDSFDLIIDGIIGYSLKGNPRESAAMMIDWANEQKTQTLALDTPSGIDLTTGSIYYPVIRADATLTLALPKIGLYNAAVKAVRGDLYLGDISVPPVLFQEPSLGFVVDPIFAESDVLLIDLND